MGEAYPYDKELLEGLDPRIDLLAQYGKKPLNVEARWEPYKYTADGSLTTHDVVIDELQSLSGTESILDAGCAGGQFDYRVRNEIGHSGRLVAFDIDRLTVPLEDNINKNGFRPIEFGVGSVLDIREPNDTFDVALALFMLYHVQDYNKAVAELNRVLRPGGLLFIATSETGNTYLTDNKHIHRQFEERVAKNLGVEPPPKFAATFGPYEALEAIDKNGFRVVDHIHQFTEMIITDGAPLMDYMMSFISMASACKPAVDPWVWLEKFDELCAPEIKTAIEMYGSFRDRINRHLFICEKVS